MKTLLILSLSLLLLGASCKQDVAPPQHYKAKKLIIIVLDGIRYTDAFADSTISQEWKAFQKLGTNAPEVYNEGVTNTVNGLCALSTGAYFNLGNSGYDTPKVKTFLHYYLSERNLPYSKAAVISSKDKIKALRYAGDSKQLTYAPYENCGNKGGGYRNDDTTIKVAQQYVQQYEPDVMILHLSEPDISGHAGNWANYKMALYASLNNAIDFYNFMEAIPAYAKQTDYLITNDHGRHTNEFTSHGDNCNGCKHIDLLCIGPDFKQGEIFDKRISQIDIPTTAAAIMGIKAPIGSGKAELGLIAK